MQTNSDLLTAVRHVAEAHENRMQNEWAREYFCKLARDLNWPALVAALEQNERLLLLVAKLLDGASVVALRSKQRRGILGASDAGTYWYIDFAETLDAMETELKEAQRDA